MNPLQHLDVVLEFLYHAKEWKRFDHIEAHIDKELPNNDVDIDALIHKLDKDGFLLIDNSSTPMSRQMGDLGYPIYAISFDGVMFADAGGYNQKAILERQERDFQKKKMNLEIKNINSGIRTNRSVRATNNIQKWLIGLATFLSAGSLVISILDYKKDNIINVPAPTVILQQQQSVSERDTSSQNTLQNQQPLKKKKTF